MTKLHSNSGQSLIEIVVAVGIIAVVLVGVSDLISRSLSLSSFQATKSVAINIAHNQLNHYRLMRDMEPTQFFTDPNPQAGYDDCVDNPNPTKYDCTISYTYPESPDVVKMTVNVRWTDGSKTIDTTLSQYLAKITK